MKKVRIITYCSALCNYGQVLQAFALQRFLRNHYKDYDIKLIYAHPFGATPQSEPPKRTPLKVFLAHFKTARRYFCAYILCIDKYDRRVKRDKKEALKNALREVLAEVGLDKNAANESRIKAFDKKREFERFKREHIALTSESLQDFRTFTPEMEADCYIVGSDQVWNDWGALQNDYTQGLDFYTLEFLPPNHKSHKISYAASIGKPKFGSEGEKAYFKNALSKFDAISLRESCNIESLKEIGLQSVCVPDPSQLLTKSDYEKLIDSSIKNGAFDSHKSDGKIRKDSVFVYMLGNETIMDKDEIMAFLSAKNSVIYTNANVDFSCEWDYKSDFAPTPQEWLACIRDCKVLVTNSFHGCAFALVMGTPFVALKLGGGASGMNTRFFQLLELFGLQNRLVDNLSDLEAQIKTPIDFESVNQKLDSWRKVGMEFLKQNLANL
ncbi:polysaccharide pyruvyl transferase family protein [Helicobacter sp. T3_23-1059]